MIILEKSRVKLNICGSDYILASEDSESYMRLVGEKVDEKLSEILAKSPKLSVSMAAVLSSLEFCDETLKSQEKNESIKSQIKDYADENAKIRKNCEIAERENFKLRSKINDLSLSIENCKRNIELLKADKTLHSGSFAPKNEVVTFSVLENEVASDC